MTCEPSAKVTCGKTTELGQVQVERKVVDLLVEQVECADMIVLNKDDRVDAKQRGVLKSIAGALNPSASVQHHSTRLHRVGRSRGCPSCCVRSVCPESRIQLVRS